MEDLRRIKYVKGQTSETTKREIGYSFGLWKGHISENDVNKGNRVNRVRFKIISF